MPKTKKSIVTDQQLNILRGLAMGLTAKGISELLGISFRTVQWHIARLHEKFGVNTTHGILMYALVTGALPFHMAESCLLGFVADGKIVQDDVEELREEYDM